jgi:hypothetical protein
VQHVTGKEEPETVIAEERVVCERARLVNFVATAASDMVVIVAFWIDSISPRIPIDLMLETTEGKESIANRARKSFLERSFVFQFFPPYCLMVIFSNRSAEEMEVI